MASDCELVHGIPGIISNMDWAAQVRQQVGLANERYPTKTHPVRDANTIYPPDLPRWIVTLSPMPTHLDWELGELLKTLGIHEMDRVSADEIHLPIWSDKIALGLFALNGLPLNNLGGSKLQVTLHETQLMAFQKDLEVGSGD